MKGRKTVQRLRSSLSGWRDVCERRLIWNICGIAALPQLSGNERECEAAETCRRRVISRMALRRRTPEREMAMLELIREHTDAAWWTDAACAGGTRGILRLLDRQAARKLGTGEFAPRPTLPSPPARYFVDGENVSPKNACMREILQKPNAHIVLFVSDRCQWPKAGNTMGEPLPDGITVERVYCGTGAKNAMDFQIVGVVGEYLARNPDGAAYIVSNDSGYDAAVKMWVEQGFSVGRIGSPAPKEKETAPQLGNREGLVRFAEASLHWGGYQGDEKARLADILAAFALGEYKAPYNRDIHAAIGHYMACGKRYTTIYAAERRNIESFLAAARAAELAERYEDEDSAERIVRLLREK